MSPEVVGIRRVDVVAVGDRPRVVATRALPAAHLGGGERGAVIARGGDRDDGGVRVRWQTVREIAHVHRVRDRVHGYHGVGERGIGLAVDRVGDHVRRSERPACVARDLDVDLVRVARGRIAGGVAGEVRDRRVDVPGRGVDGDLRLPVVPSAEPQAGVAHTGRPEPGTRRNDPPGPWTGGLHLRWEDRRGSCERRRAPDEEDGDADREEGATGGHAECYVRVARASKGFRITPPLRASENDERGRRPSRRPAGSSQRSRSRSPAQVPRR